MLRFAVLWVVFSALEVVLVGKFDAQETPVGLAVGALAAFVTIAVLRASGERYRFRFAWLRIVPTLLWNVPRDTGIVFAVLLRRLAGGALPDDAVVRIPFDPGGDDSEATARRALAVAAVSCGPNAVVLDIDRGRGALRVHYLHAKVKKPTSRVWPL